MSDGIEEKIDGLKAVMETRFSHHEKEQAGMVAWMERLSASVDRLVDFGSSLLAIQQRQSNVEAKVADMALDLDGLTSRMTNVESNSAVSKTKTDYLQWLLAATGGAFFAMVVKNLIGDK